MLQTLLYSLYSYWPEVTAIFLMCLLLIAESMHDDEDSRFKVYALSLGGLGVVLVLLFINLGRPNYGAFYNAVVIDNFSTFAKILMVIGTMGCVWLSHSSKDIYANLKAEFSIMSIGVLIGGMLLASANNLLTVFLGIETLSILSYVMSSFKRDESTSTEAGLKYALYGGITSGIMLFGMSHIYGVLGSIQFQTIAAKLPTLSGMDSMVLMASFMMFFAGIGYKIACVPFHMWSPDVYQGSPIPVTAFFSIVPKIAGMAVLVRVSQIFFSGNSEISYMWIGLLHVVAALTMSVGNISAIGQDSVKRLLAFSSIGHVGMMILGVVVLNEVGTRAILFYGATYVSMTLVAFYITSHLSDMYGTDSQSVFKGLIYRHPLMAILMITALFSLAGMPPLSGFVAKFNIISVVIEKKYYSLAFIAALNSVISLYYYLKLAKDMVFSKSEAQESVTGFSQLNQSIIAVLAFPIFFFGIFWESLMKIADKSKIFMP